MPEKDKGILLYYVLFLSWPTIHNNDIYRVMYFMLLSLIRFLSEPRPYLINLKSGIQSQPLINLN